MPKHDESIALDQFDTETALVVALQTMKNLNWPVQYAGPQMLIGSTPKSWKNRGEQIAVSSDGTELIVRSEMVNGESFDLGGRNKKNTAT